MSVMTPKLTAQSPTKPRHAVILLASGLSQRLGHAKQLIQKDQQPLLCHMVQLALTTQPSAVMVVVPKSQTAIISALDQKVIENDNLHLVVNPTPHTGMGHSLDLGINGLDDWRHHTVCDIDRVLIMGVDQVLLNQAHLSALLNTDDRHVCVTASRYPRLGVSFTYHKDNGDNHIVGLPLVVQYDMLRQWQPQLSGDKGLRAFIRALPDIQIAHITNADLSHDIDTPEQWRYAQAQGWIDSPNHSY